MLFKSTWLREAWSLYYQSLNFTATVITGTWRLRKDTSMLSQRKKQLARSIHRQVWYQEPRVLLTLLYLLPICQSICGTRRMTSSNRKSRNRSTHTRLSYRNCSMETARAITHCSSRIQLNRQTLPRDGARWICWYKLVWQERRKKPDSSRVLERSCKRYYRWRMLLAPQYKWRHKLRLLGRVYVLPCR